MITKSPTGKPVTQLSCILVCKGLWLKAQEILPLRPIISLCLTVNLVRALAIICLVLFFLYSWIEYKMPLRLMWSKIYIFLALFLTYTKIVEGSAAFFVFPLCSQALAILQNFVCLKVPIPLKVKDTVFAQRVILKLQITKTVQKTKKKLSYIKTLN